jgi:GH35 family endo-1,4-beta-xylanase
MAKTMEELLTIVEEIDNFKPSDIYRISQRETLDAMKEDAFSIYRGSMLSTYGGLYSEYASVTRKRFLIESIVDHLDLNEQESAVLYNATECKTKYKAISYIKRQLPHRYSEILNFIDNFEIIEFTGFKLNDYQNFVKLSNEINKYNIINLENIIDYPSYVKLDGSYNHKRFKFALDFAKKLGKKVRLNSCIFYKDTPEWINNLKYNKKNKYFVYNLLSIYLNDITQFIKMYESANDINIVETINLLNEPLNSIRDLRYANGFEPRNDIYWSGLARKSKIKDKNTSPGWLRFLEIEDICKLATIIRHNLPHVKLMCNEYKLENRNKAKSFVEYIVKPIQKYEIENNIKLLDIIGTQCHCSMHAIPDDYECMFENLSKTNIPIEITEFDVYVQPDMFGICNLNDLHMYKSAYMDDLYNVIIKCHEKYEIQGFTIWSINDTMSFEVDVLNKNIYQENLKLMKKSKQLKRYYTNIFGGYYDSQMNERIPCPRYRYD